MNRKYFLIIAKLGLVGILTIGAGGCGWAKNFGPGSSPALNAIYPLPVGYSIIFDETYADQGSSNTRTRIVALSSNEASSTAAAISTEITNLETKHWKLDSPNAPISPDKSICALLFSPAEALHELTNIPQTMSVRSDLRLAIIRSRSPSFVIGMVLC